MSKLTPILAVALYFTQGCGSLTSNLPFGYSPFKESEMPRYGAVTKHDGELSLEVGGCVSKNAVTYFKAQGLNEDQIFGKYGDAGVIQKLRLVLNYHRGRYGLSKPDVDYTELSPRWKQIKGKNFLCKPHVLPARQLRDLISATGGSEESILEWLAKVSDTTDTVD